MALLILNNKQELMMHIIKLMTTVLLFAVLSACGGSSGKSQKDGNTTLTEQIIAKSLDGIWSDNQADKDKKSMFILAENGQVLVHINTPKEATIIGTLSLKNKNLSIAGLLYPPWETNKPARKVSVNGSFASDSQFELNYSGANSEYSGTLTFTKKAEEQKTYLRPSSLAKLAGNWNEYASDPADSKIRMQGKADGTFTVTEVGAGCVVKGSLALINASKNLYSATVNVSGCSTAYQAKFNGTHKGIAAFENDKSMNVFTGNDKAIFMLPMVKP